MYESHFTTLSSKSVQWPGTTVCIILIHQNIHCAKYQLIKRECQLPRCLNATTSPSRFASRLQSLECNGRAAWEYHGATANSQEWSNEKNPKQSKTRKTTYLKGITRDILLLLAPNTSGTEMPGARESRCWKYPSSIPTKPTRHVSPDTLLGEHWLVWYTNPHKLEIQHQKKPSALLVTRIHPIHCQPTLHYPINRTVESHVLPLLRFKAIRSVKELSSRSTTPTPHDWRWLSSPVSYSRDGPWCHPHLWSFNVKIGSKTSLKNRLTYWK